MDLVRVVWRNGRPDTADVMWVRSVWPDVAEVPAQLAMKHLKRWEDLVMGWFTDDEAQRVRSEAESRGHSAELFSKSGTWPVYIASRLQCAPLRDEELRVTFMPSFHPEVIVTARRASDRWDFELRTSRENISSYRTPICISDWSRIERFPGINVFVGTCPRHESLEAELRREAPRLEEATAGGCDGMTVHVASRLAGELFEDERWGPEPGTRVRLAAELALLITRDLGDERLAHVARYLR